MTRLLCFSPHCALAVIVHSGRNEAQLGKVTAPEWCCLNPEGLTLWSNHSIFTGFPPCMCVLCVHLFADYAA